MENVIIWCPKEHRKELIETINKARKYDALSDMKVGSKNPFCDNCKEDDCCVSTDGTCAMIRKYIKN